MFKIFFNEFKILIDQIFQEIIKLRTDLSNKIKIFIFKKKNVISSFYSLWFSTSFYLIHLEFYIGSQKTTIFKQINRDIHSSFILDETTNAKVTFKMH